MSPCAVNIKTPNYSNANIGVLHYGQMALEPLQRENFGLGPVICLYGADDSVPVHRVGDLSSNPGPGENFSLKIKNIGSTR